MEKSEQHKAVNFIESVLLFDGIFLPIVGALCVIWFDYKLGVEIFNVGCICILVYWLLKFVVKVINIWF